MNFELISEPIKIEGQLEYKDLLRIYRETTLKIGSRTWFLLIIFGFMLFSSTVSLLLPFEKPQATSFQNHELSIYMLTYGPIVILSFVIYCIIWPPSIQTQLKTSKTLSKNSFYEISSDGIKQLNEFTEGTYKWKSFDRVHETKNDFLLYLSASECLFLPKRFFKLEEDIASMQTLIKSQVAKVSEIK